MRLKPAQSLKPILMTQTSWTRENTDYLHGNWEEENITPEDFTEVMVTGKRQSSFLSINHEKQSRFF